MKILGLRGWRLRPSIVALFIAMVLPVFGAAIWVGYKSNDALARETAEKSMERARLETISHTRSLLDPIASFARISARLAGEQPEFYRNETALASMLETVNHSVEISSVYVGFADGSYRMALRVPKGLRVHNAAPPEATRYASRWIDRRAGGVPSDRYDFLDAKHLPIGTADAPTQYDPRVRPWFRDAVEKKDLVISNPYIYATTGLPGVTVAMPFYSGGKLEGVFAIDILLDSLSAFLKQRPVSEHSLSVIVDNEGMLVAHPDSKQALKREASGSLGRVRVNELPDPLFAVAYSQRTARQQARFTFEFKGEEYAAMFSPFPREFGKEWEVIILAPLEDFVGEWKANNEKLLMFGLIAIALQVALIYAFSRRIARPLERLEQQVLEVQNFEPHKGPPVTSSIREIGSLASAVTSLQNAITAFSAFVPRDLVRQLIGPGNKLELGGRSQFLTVMFTDLESFSTWAEKTSSKEMLTRVSEYFAVVTRAVNHEHGTIDKFIGDGVMAFWGAPATLEDHVYHACAAAVRIQRGMDALNARWAEEGLAPLNVRVGIHADAVIVGNIGSMERMSYTVMGDGVNLASRLEGANKEFGTRVCVSQPVFREAGERLVQRRLGSVTVKGRRQEMEVFEVLGIKGGDPELAASPEIVKLCALSNDAYEAFHDEQWALARDRYREIVKAYPQDIVAKVMVLRCDQALAGRAPVADAAAVDGA
ncbi:adenylate/guanylate cyclase domain-containing protein [Ramlibacter sp.]|uniref:adenylate/guanylate cyclase domain-containing protein n=1 Tax=Ramlibacter sp. TaxID=1917967 RepID=UPI003D0E2483